MMKKFLIFLLCCTACSRPVVLRGDYLKQGAGSTVQALVPLAPKLMSVDVFDDTVQVFYQAEQGIALVSVTKGEKHLPLPVLLNDPDLEKRLFSLQEVDWKIFEGLVRGAVVATGITDGKVTTASLKKDLPSNTVSIIIAVQGQQRLEILKYSLKGEKL